MTKIEMIIRYKEEDYGDALDSMVETKDYYGGELDRNVVIVYENQSHPVPSQEIQQAADVLIILRPLL